DALPPARSNQSGLCRHIGKSAVAVVVIEVVCWHLSCKLGSFQARTIDQKDVEQTVIVVIKERDATTCVLQLEFILLLAAVDRPGCDSGFACDVHEPGSRSLVPSSRKHNQTHRGTDDHQQCGSFLEES